MHPSEALSVVHLVYLGIHIAFGGLGGRVGL